jgi:hypothetical protein
MRKKKPNYRRRKINTRLCHDVSWQVTTSVIEMFAPLLPETEQAEAFAQVYARVKAGIEVMEIQAARMASRMRPSRN